MSRLACKNPVKLPKFNGLVGKCGRCPQCRKMKRIEWTNRMCLEAFGKPYRPLFVTNTYAPETLPENPAEALGEVQKWIKRLRRDRKTVRYFMTTEKGSKNGRIHNHLIMWIPEISHLSALDKWHYLHKKWGLGRLEADEVRSTGAFYYTSKYILKNLTDKETDKYNRYEGKYQQSGRLYTWSNKPALGTDGLNRWKYVISQANVYEKYSLEKLPPNWIHMHILGQQRRVYIPRRNYVEFVQKTLGIDLHPDLELSKVNPAEIDQQDIYYGFQRWPEVKEKNAIIQMLEKHRMSIYQYHQS